MDDEDKLEGKVAAILNERQLVINLGVRDGVFPGLRFKVMTQPEPVEDPDTGEILDEVQTEKIRVKVSEVKPKMSIARTYETYKVNVGGSGPDIRGLAKSLQPPKVKEKVRTLKWDDSGVCFDEEINEEESCVSRGDEVVSLESWFRPNGEEFRRVEGKAKWHWMDFCTSWPTENFISQQEMPTQGELCNECRSLQASEEESD